MDAFHFSSFLFASLQSLKYISPFVLPLSKSALFREQVSEHHFYTGRVGSDQLSSSKANK